MATACRIAERPSLCIRFLFFTEKELPIFKLANDGCSYTRSKSCCWNLRPSILLFFRVTATRLVLSMIPPTNLSRPRFKLFSERSKAVRESAERMIFAKVFAEKAPKPYSFSTSLPGLWSAMS